MTAMPIDASPSNHPRFFAGAALLALAPAVFADQLTVLSEHEFRKSWTPLSAELAYLESSPSRSFLYGCISIGFIVEADGRPSGPPRLLSYRFDKDMKPNEPILQLLTTGAFSITPRFKPVIEGGTSSAVYTSISVPIRTKKLDKILSTEASGQLNRALNQACAIANLGARLIDGPKEPIELSALPSLADLTGTAGLSTDK